MSAPGGQGRPLAAPEAACEKAATVKPTSPLALALGVALGLAARPLGAADPEFASPPVEDFEAGRAVDEAPPADYEPSPPAVDDGVPSPSAPAAGVSPSDDLEPSDD